MDKAGKIMKRVEYQRTEMRTILIPDKICTHNWDEMVMDIRDKVGCNFTGNESSRVISGKININIEKVDTGNWKIISVDPVPEEKAIEKAKRLRKEYDDECSCLGGRHYATINVDEIFDAYEKAYKEEAYETVYKE